MNDYFEKAFENLMIDEGVYVNDPSDQGGETKYGISKRSYPNVDIKNLTKEKAKEIYYQDFWKPFRLDEIDAYCFANKIFNIGINIGMINVIKILQKVLNETEGDELTIDGKIGNLTRYALATAGNSTYYIFIIECAKYYLSLKNDKYLRGWLNRLFRDYLR